MDAAKLSVMKWLYVAAVLGPVWFVDVAIAADPPILAASNGIARAATSVGDGFAIVGSVAVLVGDETTATRRSPGFGMTSENLAAISRRFIAAFGDDYDQLAIFLSFSDLLSQQALAYQLPVRNDIKGLGIGLFDSSAQFGSAGRMETVLNMKRITLYGRDAANDPENDLYSVWAQEAAHRWLAYLRFQRDTDTSPRDDLLGRQKAHWANTVQADASFMDGYLWKDNGDGTFTPTERNKRYGTLDQYGMGLRTADEVPPFFILQNLTDQEDRPTKVVAVGGRYKAKRLDLTIKDIVRAMGKREPASSPAAQDLRMGVILVTAPASQTDDFVGESFRIDRTRRVWDEFYNAAGGGRGKVCTELLRPCRGPSFVFGDADLTEGPAASGKDGVVAPGEPFVLKLPVTSAGSEPGVATVKIDSHDKLTLKQATVATAVLPPGQSTTLVFDGQVPRGTPCGQALTVDLAAPGRLGPSRGKASIIVGLAKAHVDTLEDPATPTAWRVNPDGKDTATRGAWAWGAAQKTTAFEFTLQPGGAWSGSHAFVTGLSGAEDSSDQNVDDGFTTVESPPFSLAGTRQPYLSYQLYFVAADFQNEVLKPDPADSLKVQASVDGQAWTEVDVVRGMALGWTRRLVKLSQVLAPEALASGSLRFRFVAEDTGVARNIVEAVIDDVGVYDEVAACGDAPLDGGFTDGAATAMPTSGGTGCGCRLGGAGSVQGTALWLLAVGVAIGIIVRNRRRPVGAGRS